MWRLMQLSSHDMLTSMFEHEKVIMHFARIAGENLVSPDEKATGIGPFVFVGFLEAYGIGVPVGGSGKLTDALIASNRRSALKLAISILRDDNSERVAPGLVGRLAESLRS